jgi:CBS domain-containing protein
MSALKTYRGGTVVLEARTAAELMSPNPLSIRDDATLREALAFLVDRRVSGAPVIDEAGRPVGVLSRTDLLVHDRERPAGNDPARVRDLMTPVIFSVAPEAPAARVVAEMLALQVRRLFVVGGDGTLIGVVSAFDVLRHLRPGPAA